MSIQAQDLATLHLYARGVMSRASHHALDVQAVALALLGGVMWRHKPEIELRDRNQNGPALHSFSNAMSLVDVHAVFV